ncbi:MaoC/PaaZ C-terminal domain-containing protein [Pseudomonas sp. NBRC 100443]|uniref:MaoC family dehydratase n=1 Tax=Pseudomonas sp. NBRC 100443 TaxID=1113665 RepID=UPI0024A30012|nr:MaoC/PaaZ C-terminal domain-containing protein [Pseudomonas sp. NBRC 100443]GLU37371.1 hypothetical protein Pssp01_14640 [Pseudomonas sp. NBRC 100443]
MTPEIGQTLPSLQITDLSAESMKVWARILRDPNPIHLDPEAVHAQGLGDRVINQGPANLAYVISMLQAAFPQGRIETLDARYLGNAFAGDNLEAGGQVSAVESLGEGTRVTCEAWLRAQGRDKVVALRAVLTLPHHSQKRGN